MGRTRDAILTDRAAPAHVVRDSLADLALIQEQCRTIGEAEIGSGDQVPEVERVGSDAVPEVGRPAKQGLKKGSSRKKHKEEANEPAVALVEMGRRVDKPRQRQNPQRSTSRP